MDLAYIYCMLYTLIHKKDEGCSNMKSDENRNSKMKTIIYQRLTLFKVTTYMHLLMMYRAWHEMTMCDLICHHRLHSVSRISLNCSPTGDNQKILQFTFCIWTVWIDHSANKKYSYISFSVLFQTKSSLVWKSYTQKLGTIFQTNSRKKLILQDADSKPISDWFGKFWWPLSMSWKFQTKFSLVWKNH